MARASANASAPKQLSKWVEHLTKVRKANPKLSLKQAMMEAKKTYTKSK
jgi:hypothetical protein